MEPHQPGAVTLNGIVVDQAGRYLLTVDLTGGDLYRIDLSSGGIHKVALEGGDLLFGVGTVQIFTLDERYFRVIKPLAHGAAFQLLPYG